MKKEISVAQVALLSSFFTLILIVGIGFIWRGEIANYLVQTAVLPQNLVESPLVSDNDQLVKTIEKVNPAVVSVVVIKEVPIYERYYETYNPFGSFGGFSVPRVRENGAQEREVGGGSGFIVSNDGMIVTNKHVVSDPDARYSVLLNNGASYDVEVLARDPQLDVAILQISEPLESSLSFIGFGDSQSLKQGQTVIAIGNALAEFRNSVSVGVVSGLARSITASDGMGSSEQLDQVIQTDAAINPGNSGGPLLNVKGEVIGVNVATSRGADNIGFALPAHVVKGVVESVREYGEIIRPYIGVRYIMLNERIAENNDIPSSFGALVVNGGSVQEPAVIDGSPAQKVGITENTIILAIDGVELSTVDLATVLRSRSVGDVIELRLLQDGVERTVELQLEKAQ